MDNPDLTGQVFQILGKYGPDKVEWVGALTVHLGTCLYYREVGLKGRTDSERFYFEEAADNFERAT